VANISVMIPVVSVTTTVCRPVRTPITTNSPAGAILVLVEFKKKNKNNELAAIEGDKD